MTPTLLSFSLQRGIIICKCILIHQGQWTIANSMAIDTCASYTIIHPEITRRLKIGLSQSSLSETTGISGTVKFPKIVIQQIGIQAVNAENVEVLVGALPSSLGLQGVLGYSFLKNFDYCVYYQRQEIVLTPI